MSHSDEEHFIGGN